MKRAGAVLAIAVLTLTASPAMAQVRDVPELSLAPESGTKLRFRSGTYVGDLTIRSGGDGLVVVETTDVDSYLMGIREVPFSWEEEALAAQVVAARTFLAWTLNRGRSTNGRRYGYDICATTACQVYAGVGLIQGAEGGRWLEAIERTSDEVLLYDGAPAQTFYSSSSGLRTRAKEDVFGGTPVPYLQAVESPEADFTPYLEWSVELPVEAVLRILRRAGYAVGDDLRAVVVRTTPDGGGPWRTEFSSERGVTVISNEDMRWLFNAHGPALYPGLLPASRPDGRRWPQAILSYTFNAELDAPPATPVRPSLARLLPRQDRPTTGTVRFTGTGWGHGVGMSQWGAQAMASGGASYAEILGNYYAGLAPQPGDGLIPDEVVVGLAWRQTEVVVDATGSFTLLVGDVTAYLLPGGEWTFRSGPAGVEVVPPPEYEGIAVVAGKRWPR